MGAALSQKFINFIACALPMEFIESINVDGGCRLHGKSLKLLDPLVGHIACAPPAVNRGDFGTSFQESRSAAMLMLVHHWLKGEIVALFRH